MGNLIPAAICVPLAAYGVLLAVRTQQFTGIGLWYVVGSVVLMWLLVNFVGAFENPRLKREMRRRIQAKEIKLDESAIFVGFARPAYAGLLDPHEDIGFLSLNSRSASFYGETIELEVSIDEIERVRYRFNPHALAGLGKWVSIEGKSGNTPFRMLIEPREKKTLLGNLFYSKSVKKQIEAWLKAERPEPKPGP